MLKPLNGQSGVLCCIVQLIVLLLKLTDLFVLFLNFLLKPVDYFGHSVSPVWRFVGSFTCGFEMVKQSHASLVIFILFVIGGVEVGAQLIILFRKLLFTFDDSGFKVLLGICLILDILQLLSSIMKLCREVGDLLNTVLEAALFWALLEISIRSVKVQFSNALLLWTCRHTSDKTEAQICLCILYLFRGLVERSKWAVKFHVLGHTLFWARRYMSDMTKP
jgi:hypothetical protein